MKQTENSWLCPQCGKKTSQDKQFCEHCSYNIGRHNSPWSDITIHSSPGWVDTFNRLNPHPEAMDAEGERHAVDVMLDEKESELKNSKRAQRWEKGRKAAWKRNLKYKKSREREHRRKVDKAKGFALEYLREKTQERKGTI